LIQSYQVSTYYMSESAKTVGLRENEK